MSQASQAELLMLGLINEERTSRGLDPLTINANLNDASEDHSQWMLDTDTFSHTGQGGSSATQRIENADYALEGSWATAENIGWQSERGAPGIADDVRDIHESLMNSPGHRANLLNPDLEDIGIGIEVGDFDGYEAVMITQNFGATDAVSDAPDPTPTPGPALATPDPETVPETDTAPDPEDVAEVPDAPTPDEDGAPVADDAPDQLDTAAEVVVADEAAPDPAPATPEDTETAEIAPDFCDVFQFLAFDCMQANDGTRMSNFEGTITTNTGTQTVTDRATFDTLLAAIFEDMETMTCGADTDFI